MITVPELAADALGKFLANYMRRRFGSSQTHLVEMVPSIARIALECIGNSDALYHNVEHTMLVTLAGHDILRGRALHAHMPAEDYAHVIIACLTHDIGYVRGLFKADDKDGYVVDSTGRKVALPRGASDASLLPYHVDRSKMFVMERIEGMAQLDKRRTVLRIRGGRAEPSARLFLARRSRQPLSAVLLEQRRAPCADRDPLSQRHLARSPVDRQPLQQRLPRRARNFTVGAAEVMLASLRAKRSNPEFPR